MPGCRELVRRADFDLYGRKGDSTKVEDRQHYIAKDGWSMDCRASGLSR